MNSLSPAMSTIRAWLQKYRIAEVECLLPDFTGITRGKIMPVEKFCAERGMRLPESVQIYTVTGDYIADEWYDTLLDPADIDMVLLPDENAIYPLPWIAEPTAAVIHDSYDKQGQLSALSSRALLKHVLALYKARNWTPIVAPELEFYLTQPCPDPNVPLTPPIGRSGMKERGRQAFSIAALNEFDPLFEDLYHYAEVMGLNIDTLVHEEGTAQIEINFRHGDPLHLADQVLLFKRAVREVALKHHISATFMAKPISQEPGSAMHIHHSVLDATTGVNIFGQNDGLLSAQGLHYIGGMQRYIPALFPLFAPNVNSYRRFITDSSTPINLEWGEDNRTAGLRVPVSDAANRRIENRLPGADVNPYLAIAASLLCGYLGMSEAIQPSQPVQGSAYGHHNLRLPATLEQALEHMASNRPLAAILGERFVTAYIAVKQAECDSFKQVISAWEREFLLSSV